MTVVAKQRVARLDYFRSMLQSATQDGECAFLQHMRSMLGAAHCIPVGRARTGIYLLVRNAVAPGRTKVLMSPLTIPDVVNMIRLAGGTPVFIDSLPGSTNIDVSQLETLLGEDVACVLITHYHVNQNELGEIRAACGRAGVPLYDDCAIAFGGMYGDAPLGSCTDGSIFSFSVYKFLNFYWGGLVTTTSAQLAARIESEVAGWPRLSRSVYLRNARSAIMYDLATRPALFRLLTFPLLQNRASRSQRSVELSYPRRQNQELGPTLTTRPSLSAFAEWTRKLEDVREIGQRRRKIAAIYRARLGGLMLSAESSEHCMQGSCFVNFPILVPAARRDDIHREAMLAGYDLGKSLYPNVHEIPEFRDIEGRSENVARLVRSTLYLPTHFGVSEDYAEELSDTIALLA
jgi:dTDP-4-amino-4,6-dideoxygalactose transaminase